MEAVAYNYTAITFTAIVFSKDRGPKHFTRIVFILVAIISVLLLLVSCNNYISFYYYHYFYCYCCSLLSKHNVTKYSTHQSSFCISVLCGKLYLFTNFDRIIFLVLFILLFGIN